MTQKKKCCLAQCNKGVLKLPKNPYTAHQQAARNLPNSFFVKDKAELRAGKSRGDLVRRAPTAEGTTSPHCRTAMRMLLPEVKSLLEDMGHAFADQLEGTKSEGTTVPRDELDKNRAATGTPWTTQLQRH